MKRINIFILVVFLTALPIVIDFYISTDTHYPFIWSLLLIPNFIIVFLYTKWKVIISSALFFTVLQLFVKIIQYKELNYEEWLLFVASTVVHWLIYLTVVYFRNHYKKLLNEVEKLAIIDPLTGVYNRRYFDKYLEKHLSFPDCNLVLILLDIDHFKKFNDTYGHIYGDVVLKHLTKIIKRSIRKSDKIVRIGGEEFAILLPKTQIEKGLDIAQLIRKNVENSKLKRKGKLVSITISLGVSKYNGQTVIEFYESTDKALYKAKENGRNQVVVFNEICNEVNTKVVN